MNGIEFLRLCAIENIFLGVGLYHIVNVPVPNSQTLLTSVHSHNVQAFFMPNTKPQPSNI